MSKVMVFRVQVTHLAVSPSWRTQVSNLPLAAPKVGEIYIYQNDYDTKQDMTASSIKYTTYDIIFQFHNKLWKARVGS